jgi:hypothetical protein
MNINERERRKVIISTILHLKSKVKQTPSIIKQIKELQQKL